jgi:hypothetical protein
MEIKQNPNSNKRNQGQTLAEFALTLPILLLLLFGIIEFGRLFQSWVTIQNAVRAAARYVVTGRYDEIRYPSLDVVIPCKSGGVTLAVGNYLAPLYTPPGFDNGAFQADVTANGQIYNDRYQYSSGVLSRKVPIFVDNGVADNEHLYRTWYGVPDCAPGPDADQDRKDILRLPSVYNVARIGAAGLSLEANPTNLRSGETEPQALQRFLFSTFSNPSPSVDTPAWFNVLICSGRAPRYGSFGDARSGTDGAGQNMFDYVEGVNDQDVDYAEERLGGFPGGACVNKEKLLNVPGASAFLDHYGVTKMDAGEAGESVYILITYNHPLITPLGLARYVQMQGSRAAINESFKVTNAERALGPSQPAPPELPEETAAVQPTPVTPSITPSPTLTPTPVTPTNTPTPAVFSCENISVSPIGFTDNRVILTITNANRESTHMTGAKIIWDDIKLKARSATAGVQQLGLSGDLMWFGDKKVSPVDTRLAAKYPNPDTGNGVSYITVPPQQPSAELIGQDRVEELGNGADNTNEFQVTFSGIATLRDVFEGWEFAGSELYFDNPNSTQDCVIRLIVPNAPPPPTNTPIGFVPSPTATPNCASNLLKVTFERFDNSGDLVLKITNNRTVVAPFRGFSLSWPAYKAPNLRFVKMVVGGNNADDSTGTIVWNSIQGGGYRPANVVFNVPPASVTRHDDITAGTWNDNNDPFDVAYSFPAQSTTFLYIDFTGTGFNKLDQYGIAASDFNGTRFFIECGRGNRNPNGTCSTNPCNGGPWSGGGGGGGLGDIGLDNQPTPAPTVIVTTGVPAPTLTPSRTPIPQPPTNTFTPGPTRTFTRTPLPNPPTNTPTNTPTRTPVGFNPGD